MARINTEKLEELTNSLTPEERQRVRNLLARQTFDHFRDENDSLSFTEWTMMNLSAVFTVASTRDDFNPDMVMEILETDDQDE